MADRDARGRFLPGNRASRGNPLAGRVAKLRSALIRAVSPEDMREMVQALVARARGGDVAAAKLVLSYAVGRPSEAPRPDEERSITVIFNRPPEDPNEKGDALTLGGIETPTN